LSTPLAPHFCWMSISAFPASRLFPGKSVDANSKELFGPFSLTIPTTVEKTIYSLNGCLVQWTIDARGAYYKFLNHLGANMIEVR
jgi:hypothetical protein